MSDLKRRAADDAPAKAAKKKRKSKYQAEDESLDTELGVNTLFARLDSQLLADYLAQKTSRFGTDLSPVELSDITISGTSFSTLLRRQLRQFAHLSFSQCHHRCHGIPPAKDPRKAS